jgi:hypothetical protein
MFRSNRSHALYQSEYLFQAIGELYELLYSRPIPTDKEGHREIKTR